jgi:hypothetical protein
MACSSHPQPLRRSKRPMYRYSHRYRYQFNFPQSSMVTGQHAMNGRNSSISYWWNRIWTNYVGVSTNKRSVDQQMEYEVFKRQLTQTWKSVLDYVLCTKLDVPRCVHAETGLAYAQSSSPVSSSLTETDTTTTSSPLPSPKTIVLRNDFPYYTAENIHHYVLWKLHGICSDDDIAQAKEDVKQELELGDVENGDGDNGQAAVVVDCLHWIHPPHLKSLPDIDHVHILCQLQQRQRATTVAMI